MLMLAPTPPPCADLEYCGFDAPKAAEETWEAMLSAGVFVEGDFTFASGIHATLKADTERLYSHPKQLQVILGLFATFPCVKSADVLLYVPDGMREFIKILGHELERPVAHTERKPDAVSKYDFMFTSPADEELAIHAKQLLIGEDVVTTLGSVAAVRALLSPLQKVHSLAMLLRGTVDPKYQLGLTDHYLLQREIPTDKVEFQRRLHQEWAA